MKEYDVLIIGSIAGHDLIFAEYLSRKGLRCCIMRRESERNLQKEEITSPEFLHKVFTKDRILYYKNELDFLKITRKSHLILSLTGSLIGAIKKMWFLRVFLNLPPIINVMTGADIT